MAKSRDNWRIGIVVLFLALTWRAAQAQSFEDYLATLKSMSGPNATDCGIVHLKEQRAKARACATDAWAKRMPFFVVFQEAGIDSQVFLGLAANGAGELHRVSWDSDVTGGGGAKSHPKMTKSNCDTSRSDAIANCMRP
jgi:hypothetical protein